MTISLPPQTLPISVMEKRKTRRRIKQTTRTTTGSTPSSQVLAGGLSSSSLSPRPTSKTIGRRGRAAAHPPLVDPSNILAIVLWYTLGIVSISTTKLLLVQGTPPLLLTIQQLFIGSTVLKGYISWNNQDDNSKRDTEEESLIMEQDVEYGASHRPSDYASSTPTATLDSSTPSPLQLWHDAPYLVAAGVFFTLGFLATNLGFQASSASFVETIKAAEPLTSAGLAVGFGLESLTTMEWASLATLIIGVLASTLGNSSQSHHSHPSSSVTAATTISFRDSLLSCGIVMASNLCFSLRGLYQKWYSSQEQQKQSSAASQPKAEELQVQMQQVGVWVLLGPAIVGYGRWALVHLIQEGVSIHYVGLALINGLAFTSYK